MLLDVELSPLLWGGTTVIAVATIWLIRKYCWSEQSCYENGSLATKNEAGTQEKDHLDLNENKQVAGAKDKHKAAGIDTTSSKEAIIPLSVNYHFTRSCNYSCGFCFHTATTSFVLPLAEAERGLRMLQNEGMVKVNFSGGEPFLTQRGRFLGHLVRFCKQELQLQSVSVVTNGSLVTEQWFQTYGEYLDIMAVSCDSFDAETNERIGRQQGKKNHLDSLRRVRDWCRQYKVAFKLNSVINTHNVQEDMVDAIEELQPVRWKVFQCLLIAGENSGEKAIKHAQTYVISEEQFDDFLARHRQVTSLVPESNEKMRNSYLILDECMRFLDCTGGEKKPSASLLDVGVQNALLFSGFDQDMFFKRGGKYTWSKADLKLDW